MQPVNKKHLKSITKSKPSQKKFGITADNRHHAPRLYKNEIIKSNKIKSEHKEVNDGSDSKKKLLCPNCDKN